MVMNVIMDSQLNNASTCSSFEFAITQSILKSMGMYSLYIAVSSKRADTVYPPYALTLKETAHLKGAVYLTNSRARAQKAVELGLKPVFIDKRAPMALRGRYTVKQGIVRVVDALGFMEIKRIGWFG